MKRFFRIALIMPSALSLPCRRGPNEGFLAESQGTYPAQRGSPTECVLPYWAFVVQSRLRR
jgi:hypothetical protein